jgi:lantibiotic modifying enzyme
MMCHVEDALLHQEVKIAQCALLKAGLSGADHSLCHGDLGKLELLLQTRESLGEEEVAAAVIKVMQSARQHGWRCGAPRGVEVPGLMTGLAGIGYGLIRIAEPNAIPSILTLNAPHRADPAGR